MTISAMIELLQRQTEYIENHATGHLELDWCEERVAIKLQTVDKVQLNLKKQELTSA